MTSPYQNLSGEFSEKLVEGSCSLLCGTKGSGKTSLALAIIRYCLENDVFKEYLLIIPNYENEASGSYSWIDKMAREKKKQGIIVTIFDTYHPLIPEMIIDRKEHHPVFFLLDDATSMSLMYINKDEPLKKCIINARHYHLSIMFCLHSIKNVLSGIIRDNLSFIAVFDIASRKLLMDLYEIYFSLRIKTFNEFYELYQEHIKREYGTFLLFTGKDKQLDDTMLEWSWIAESIKKNMSEKKIK